jgi:SAM-dependent methyltransferase
MVAGEEYVAAITAVASDRRARRAFRDLVLEMTAPGSCIFDFGAGPGIDAKFYAECGFRVVAYDADPRMCASFARHCRREIDSGQIHLYQGEYRNFLELQIPAIRQQYGIDAVTANFAPLSLIDDPHELFAKLHALTGPNAMFFASVLSPEFIGDMRYAWWWANRMTYWRRGHFRVAGETASIFRRSLGNFAAQAAPYFTLQNAIRGLPRKAGSRIRSSGRLALALSRYTFLVFAKR